MEVKYTLLELSYNHISVYQRYANQTPSGYSVEAEDGFVFYNPNELIQEVDPITQEIISEHYNYLVRSFLPQNFDFHKFNYIAKPKQEVNQDYII